MKATQTLLGFFVLLLTVSCSSDLDFDQVNDLQLQPVVVANLSSFDVAANQFVNNGTEQAVSIDTPDVGVFNDSFFRDNLSKADLFSKSIIPSTELLLCDWCFLMLLIRHLQRFKWIFLLMLEHPIKPL